MGKKKNVKKSIAILNDKSDNTINKVHIAVLMMVKNEKARLHVSLESIKKFADSLVLYDTGSTDNTIEIAKTFCENNNIIFRLKQGEFVNFSVSRNVSLDFADTFPDIDFILLMDTNDELQNPDELRKFAEAYKNSDKTCFLMCQQWFSGLTRKYFNIRFIKPRNNWRYKGSVHEYIWNDTRSIESSYDKIPESIFLYQDRTQDDDKTSKRFSKDKEMLLEELKKNPDEPRNVFYLAQTCACLNQREEALKWYLHRTTLQGFWEERYHSWYCAGELSLALGKDWYDCFKYFMKAFDVCERVEPILRVAEFYITIKKWSIAHTFLQLASRLNYPIQCILFVDKLDYDYKRWHLLGLCAYYVNSFEEGREACIQALKYKENPIDKNNLKYYTDKLQEIKIQQMKNNRNKRMSK